MHHSIEKPHPIGAHRHWILLIVGLVLLLVFCSAPGLTQDDGARGFQSAKGRTTFRLYCASCHGPEGRGDGPVAKHLTVAATDLTRISERYGGEFPHEWIRQIIDGRAEVGPHGSREMPVWGDVFQAPVLDSGGQPAEDGTGRAERKIDELVVYLESIQLRLPPEP